MYLARHSMWESVYVISIIIMNPNTYVAWPNCNYKKNGQFFVPKYFLIPTCSVCSSILGQWVMNNIYLPMKFVWFYPIHYFCLHFFFSCFVLFFCIYSWSSWPLRFIYRLVNSTGCHFFILILLQPIFFCVFICLWITFNVSMAESFVYVCVDYLTRYKLEFPELLNTAILSFIFKTQTCVISKAKTNYARSLYGDKVLKMMWSSGCDIKCRSIRMNKHQTE